MSSDGLTLDCVFPLNIMYHLGICLSHSCLIKYPTSNHELR